MSNHINWREQLRTQGFAHFPHLTPEPLIKAARDAIEIDLSSNYDPDRQSEYDNQSYCPDLKGTPPIMNLLVQSPVHNLLDEIFEIDNIDWDQGQIAIRRAHNHPQPVPPTPHIDGFSSGLNAVPDGKIYNHTILVGVFLTPVQSEFAGNFTVWPGSHHVYEDYFRVRGPRAMSEPAPALEIGPPVQLKCDVGDVVLAHYQLGHSAAVNTAAVDRIAVYFRVWLRSIESDRWHYLTNIWDGWKL
jgi:ectoine hydroxylase-related dioxygenase (phytanoyl-CoA dioxygenase family)